MHFWDRYLKVQVSYCTGKNSTIKKNEVVEIDKEAAIKELEKYANPQQAVQMKAYMRNQFDFLGIHAGKRRKITYPFIKQFKKDKEIDWDFLHVAFNHPYRECQYLGSDYLIAMQKHLLPEDLPKIKKLILTQSWWDTVDSLDKVVGQLLLTYPELNKIVVEWSLSDSIWLRRVAINHQRHRKELTNTDLLATIIDNNLNQTEFFINKAIGWALRDFSKTHPKWVSQYIEENKAHMHPLSIREASKYLTRQI